MAAQMTGSSGRHSTGGGEQRTRGARHRTRGGGRWARTSPARSRRKTDAMRPVVLPIASDSAGLQTFARGVAAGVRRPCIGDRHESHGSRHGDDARRRKDSGRRSHGQRHPVTVGRSRSARCPDAGSGATGAVAHQTAAGTSGKSVCSPPKATDCSTHVVRPQCATSPAQAQRLPVQVRRWPAHAGWRRTVGECEPRLSQPTFRALFITSFPGVVKPPSIGFQNRVCSLGEITFFSPSELRWGNEPARP